ncbi:HdeD family acid-resistance protein [Glycomyces buryatensis]|uniref:HdeD family acid-resistance protein n=1 Tax=Glycomyces buryatensis TaxID=2570927 RepID=A0A4S8QBK2_9ACTN|nr:HdeD family acid-resistance protein [Glycomyces buryatensis]THV41738.1 HdeD family acid-resistance protein [Glycomyces buryatensis]
MLELLAKNWAWVLARGIITLLFGALAVFWPGITLLALVILFGAYAIVDGITAIVMGMRKETGRGWTIFIGVMGVIAGLIALVWPGISALALLYVIAFWALVLGIGYIVKGFGVKGDAGGRWMLVFSGLVGVILGILLLARPGEGAVALVLTIGFLALIWGVITIISSIRLRRLAKELDTE